MAIRRSVLDRKYTFEYDVGLWTFGKISVMKSRETGTLRTCKTVPKAALNLRSLENVVPRLKALRDLRHPHICHVTDVMEDNDNIYIMLDFCAGGEVTDWISRLEDGFWLQENTCVAYVRQGLLALSHSHSANVFHRDLNPSSMQLTSKLPDAQVRIMDFGLAAVLDPDNSIIHRHPSPYTAPEVLRSSSPMTDGSADLWSLGAIAHTLLTGRPPNGNGASRASGQWLARMQGPSDEDSWSERSKLSRDFVMQLLGRAGDRPTLARALQHPWIKGIQAISGVHWQTDTSAAKEIRHKTVCYMLAVLLVPVLVPYRDFEQLRVAFGQGDTDSDGIVPRRILQRLLLGRCQYREAVDAALNIVDIAKAEVLDLSAAACADLIAREFFGAGPSSQPLVGPFGPKDLAPRLLKRFFETYGDRRSAVVCAAGIKGRIRTATLRDFEQHAGVRYDDILADFPEHDTMDSQMLAAHLSVSQGRGTPLHICEDALSNRSKSCSAGWGSGLGFIDLFHQCGGGSAGREESPHSVNVLVR